MINELVQQIRECVAGHAPEDLEDQILASTHASEIPDVTGLARYLSAVAQAA